MGYYSELETVVVKALARRVDTPGSILFLLHRSLDEQVRQYVASNSASPANILIALSYDVSIAVRSRVAQNPSSPATLLWRLWAQGDPLVLMGLAKNPSTPTEIIDQMVRVAYRSDCKTYNTMSLADVAARNQNAPSGVLPGSLAEERYWTELHVACNPNVPSEILEAIALEASNPGVRDNVARNPGASAHTLRQIAASPVSLASNPNAPSDLLESFRWWDKSTDNYELRAALAANRNTPAYVLSQLSSYSLCRESGIVASNPSTSPEDLARLAKTIKMDRDYDDSDRKCYRRNREGVASNPSAPFYLLDELSRSGDKGILRALAGNPSTPTEILNRLASSKDDTVRLEVYSNPHFDITSHVDLEALAKEGIDALRTAESFVILARRDDSGQEALRNIARKGDAWERASVAERSQINTELIIALAGDSSPMVRSRIASRNDCPADVCARLLGDRDKRVRNLASKNPNIPSEALGLSWAPDPSIIPAARRVVRDESTASLYDAARGHDTPFEIQQTLLGEGVGVRKVLAANTHADPAILLVLADDSSSEVIEKLVSNPSAPADALRKIAASPRGTKNRWYQKLLAENPSVPGDILEQYSNSTDLVLRLKVAANRGTTRETLSRLSRDVIGRVRGAVARNDSADEDTLNRLALDCEPWIRMGVAHNQAAPRRTLGMLCRDEVISVRIAAALNPNAPIADVELLSKDRIVPVRIAVASRHGVSPAILRELACDEDQFVRIAASINPGLPTNDLNPQHIQSMLSPLVDESTQAESSCGFDDQFGEPSVQRALYRLSLKDVSSLDLETRCALAQRADTPGQLLTILADDNTVAVRRLVAGNPLTPAHSLEALANESDDGIRESLAGNPSTPPEVLSLLVEIGVSGGVSQAQDDALGRILSRLAYNPSLSDELFAKLMQARHVMMTFLSQGIAKSSSVESRLRCRNGLSSKFLAGNPSSPASTLSELAVSKSHEVRAAVAGNPSVPEGVLAELARDSDPDVVSNAARNVNATSDVLWDAFGEGARTYRDPVVLAALAESTSDYVRYQVASNYHTPEDVLENLLDDECEEVRREAEFNAARLQLAGRLTLKRHVVPPVSTHQIRTHTGCGPLWDRYSSKTFKTYSRFGNRSPLYNIAANPNLPDDLRNLLLMLNDQDVMEGLAANPSTPYVILTGLATNEDPAVRMAVAGNPAARDDILRTMARDQVDCVRRSVALNKNTSDSILHDLCSDASGDVLASVVSNNNLSSDDQLMLAVGGPYWLREEIAGRASLSIDALKLLIEDTDENVRAKAGACDVATASMLEKLARDKSDLVRQSVASNTRTPATVLRSLVQDDCAPVRTAALMNPVIRLVEVVDA